MQKTLTRVIGEGTAWTTISTVAVKVVSLATVFITLRSLSVYEYGVSELVIAAVGFFSIFQLPGFSSVVVTDIGVEKGKGNVALAKGIYWSYLRLAAFMGVVAWAILFFGSEFVSSFYPEHIARYFRILAFTFPLSVVAAAFTIIFIVTFRYFEQSLSSFLQEAFKLVIMLVCLFWFGLKVEAVLYGIVFSQALTLLVQYPSARRAYRSLGGDAPATFSLWRTLLEHGKWSIFSTYLNSFSVNLRAYIIKAFAGTEAVALFAVAFGLTGHTIALTPIGNVVSPIIPQYVDDRPRFLRIISKSIKYQVISSVLVMVVAMIFFPPIIAWLFPQYAVAMPLYRIMVFALVPLGATSIFTAVFFALKAQRNLFLATLLRTGYVTIFTVMLLPLLGVLGAAYAYLAAVTLYAYERYRHVRRLVPEYSLPVRSLTSFDEIDRLIVGKVVTTMKRWIFFLR